MDEKFTVRAQRQPWSGSVCFWLFRGRAIGLPIQFKDRGKDSEGMHQQETFECPDSSAQAFMDELWHEGFRPTEGSGSAGSLAATERHLADMRALVAKALSTDLPKA